jgi:ATP-binding cassette, subfamily B, bacterial
MTAGAVRHDRPPADAATESSAALLARAARLYGGHGKVLALLLATLFAVAVLGVVNPLLTKVVFDRALFPATGEPDVMLLVWLALVMTSIVAVTSALAVVQAYLGTRMGQDVMDDLRRRVYARLQRMPLRFFTSTRVGEMQARIGHDVGAVGPVAGRSGVTLFANGLIVVATLVAMSVLAWQLMLVSLVLLPPFIALAHRVARARRKVTRSVQESAASVSVITEETLSVSGALLTRLFARHDSAESRFGAESRRLADLRVREAMVGRATLGLGQAFFLLAPVLVYLVAGMLLAQGNAPQISPGTLVAFTALQIRLFVPARDLMESWIEVHSSLAVFERIFSYVDLAEEIVERPGSRELATEEVRGEVAFSHVYFRYPSADAGSDGGARPWTLEDVDAVVAPGSVAAIVGHTGAGKTTLAYLVARLYDVDSGAVTIDGIDVRDLRLESLAEIVGVVTQDTHLFHASVLDNVAFARPDATQAEVEAACRAAHIHDRICELERGYDTVVGERGYRMSGGERQRLAIARALLKDPRILILDEATSALDTESERLVQRALRELLAGRTTIAIAHRLSTVVNADVIFVLERGRIVERGTHGELLARGGRYAQLYEEQLRPVAAGGLR